MDKKTGRPLKIDNNKLQKLEQGFLYGLTDRECCLYAEIAEQTLYNYCKTNPSFLERKELLKKQPTIKAKMNVVNSINKEDKEVSKWYLERKAKEEFSIKQEIEANVDGKLEISMTKDIEELAK